MKIKNLKINGYGKINDKEIDFKDKINIVHGKNEAGKSTTLNFIHNMFYGISKNKNGKPISDFEKFKPWKSEEFSGKIKYTLDNGESFEIYRDFKKKNPIIYDKNKNDISCEYSVDKSVGINFLNEQIGIDEDIFKNTVITYQDEIKMSKSDQNIIIQKISNIVSSGDENVSFKKTLDKINKLQNEEIGTSRTTQKPINIINNKIDELNKKKNELSNYKNMIEQTSSDYEKTSDSVKTETIKLDLYKKQKSFLEGNKVDYAEIDVNKNLEQGYDEKVKELKEKIDKNAKLKNIKDRKSFAKNYLFIFLFTLIILVTAILKVFVAVPIIFGIIDIIVIITTIIGIKKFNNQKKKKLEELEEIEKNIKQEIEIITNNKKERENDRLKKEEQINKKNLAQNQKLKSEFINLLDNEFIENVFDMNYDEISIAIENKEELIGQLRLKLNAKETEKQVMNDKLDDLAKIEENLENALEEKEELNSLNNSYNIAKECIKIAYEKIRDSLSPEFTSELCNLISSISSGKYNNIKFSDTEGLIVEIDDGRYISAQNLSIGTVDQMYLALRISSLKAISKENMPIILDEAFVYFDDERLKNILEFLYKNYEDKQIIIFTCSNREKNVLDNSNLQYNLIDLEN